MKRSIVLILALVLVLLTGCSGQKHAEKKESALSVTYNQAVITLDAPADPVLSALGASFGMTEEAGCAGEGKMRTYDYGSFYLQTYETETGYRIYGLWFTNNGISTQEGIHIGSTIEDVKAAYGEVEETDCGVIMGYCTVAKDNGTLSIVLSDGLVTDITYTIPW